MKTTFRILLILCIMILNVHAQYSNVNWLFGDSCHVVFNNNGIDTVLKGSTNNRGSCVSISDSVDNLLFYASTPRKSLWQSFSPYIGGIFNNNHQLMQNGDSIAGSNWYKEMQIIPYPEHPNQFILFSAGVTSSFSPGLRYSIIDLNFNGGLGKVIQKNILLDPAPVADGMIAIKHANGRDWWLYFKNWTPNNNIVKRILISPVGFSSATIQNIGALRNTNIYRYCLNPAGNTLAGICSEGVIELFDIDRCSGVLSNHRTIIDLPAVTLPADRWYCDGEFSANGRYLYAATWLTPVYLYQYDLLSANITASEIIIDTTSYPHEAGCSLERGPDNRIYRAIAWNDGMTYNYPYPDSLYNLVNTHLSVINSPDSAGLACDYQAFSVPLPGCRTYLGLPNNPDWNLGVIAGSICDTLTVGINQSVNDGTIFFQAWYNRDWDLIQVNASHITGKTANLQVHDTKGSLLYHELVEIIPGGYITKTISMKSLPVGTYIVSLIADDTKHSQKIVKW